MRVVLAEPNIRMGKSCYLPLATGLLRAYAEQFDDIKNNYQFAPFIYHIDSPANILKSYDERTDVAAFSTAVWNEQLNLTVASEVKRRWPECLIVFGGLQVPDDATDYLRKHLFIDVTVRRGGEVAFAEVLRRNLESRDFRDIPQVGYCSNGDVKSNYANYDFKRELNELPSPALAGLFDGLMERHPHEIEFSMVLESDRGCPFLCAFCEFGLSQHKMSYYGLERVFAEIDWLGRNKCAYALGSAANFGMNKHDREIAEYLVATKKKYGYPDKFRVNYGKNTDDKIFEVAKILADADMSKSVTLARQSNDAEVLKNIKRSNIKLSTYTNLQRRFNDENIPTYSEFIIGLPGETFDSYVRGLDDTFEAGMRGHVLTYPLMALPNTEMGRPDYQRQFDVKTRRMLSAEVHGTVRSENLVPEYEDIVVETSSMPVNDWRRMVIYSHLFGALVSLKLGYFVAVHLWERYGVKLSEWIGHIMERPGAMFKVEIAEHNRVLDGALNKGTPLNILLPEYGDVYWSGDEATYLRLADRPFDFGIELLASIWSLLKDRGIAPNLEQLTKVVMYQQLRTPFIENFAGFGTMMSSSWNLHEHFESMFTSKPIPLYQLDKPEIYIVKEPDFHGDKKRFAYDIILRGRRSGALLLPVAVS